MSQSARLAVKGAKYYSASSLLKARKLPPGTLLSLRHESNNPHDSNAVAVHVRATGAKLGHIARELAPKYAALVDRGMVVEAKICSASQDGGKPVIHFTVAYRLSGPAGNVTISQTQSLPEHAGVYAIWNHQTYRAYIGSSINIKRRVAKHFQELLAGVHSNRLLQNDFNSFGSSAFSASKLVLCEKSALASNEAQEIAKRLSFNCDLYNSTANGQGVGFRPKSFGQASSVSDRMCPTTSNGEAEKPQPEQPRSGCLGIALVGAIGLSYLIGCAANLSMR